MRLASRGAVLIAVFVAVASATTSSPVANVIQVLTDLQTKTEADAAAEATSYGLYATYCQETLDQDSTAVTEIRTLSDSIDTDAATVTDELTSKKVKQTKLVQDKLDIGAKQAELTEEADSWAQAKSQLDADISALAEAVDRIERATAKLTELKGGQFLQADKADGAKQAIQLAASLGMLPRGNGAPAAEALLQDGPFRDFKSGTVLTILEDLGTKLGKKKETLVADLDIKTTAHTDTEKALNEGIAASRGTANTGTEEIAAHLKAAAEAKGRLVVLQADLKAAKEFLHDVTASCEAKAKEHDQRSTSRSAEKEAIVEAIGLLSGLGGQSTEQAPVSFLQLRSGTFGVLLQGRRLRGSSESASPAADGADKVSERQQREAAAYLQSVDGMIGGSATLSEARRRILAEPFAKVKNLIQELIQRLLEEAAQETDKKGYCDKQLAKAGAERDHRHLEVQKITADLMVLNAAHATAEESLDTLRQELPDLKASSETGREESKQTIAMSIDTARKGAVAVGQAISALQAYFGRAKHAADVERVASAAGAPDHEQQGAYRGNQVGGNTAIGLLQVLKSDFERSVKDLQAQELQEESAHQELMQGALALVSQKETMQSLSQQDKESLKAEIDSKNADLKTAQDLIDLALKTIEDLRPMCIDSAGTAAERIAQRKAEIDALKQALCKLGDTGGECAE